VLIDDASAQLEVAVFAELFDRRRAILKEDQLVFVTGRARFDEFSQRLALTADDVVDLAEARAQSQAALAIQVRDGTDRACLTEVLSAYRAPPVALEPGADPDAPRQPGAAGCRVIMRYANRVAAAEIVLPDAWRVRGDERLLDDLRNQANVQASFHYA